MRKFMNVVLRTSLFLITLIAVLGIATGVAVLAQRQFGWDPHHTYEFGARIVIPTWIVVAWLMPNPFGGSNSIRISKMTPHQFALLLADAQTKKDLLEREQYFDVVDVLEEEIEERMSKPKLSLGHHQ